jgi:chromosome segregation ATPase
MKQTHRISGYVRPARLGVLSLAIMMCMAGMAPHADASDKRASREREALRRVQQQLSQVQGQLDAVEQEKGKLAADLEQARALSKAVEDKAASLQRGLGTSKQQLASAAHELTQVKEELTTTAQRLAETQKILADTTRVLQQTQAEKRDLEATKTRNERDIAACERKNLALYSVGRSLMDRFEHKTCGEILAEKEPFSGLKKVETENLLEEYRDKLDDQKLIKPPGG